MKLKQLLNRRSGFTLTEMMVAMAASSVVLGTTLTSSTSLQKSFKAIDSYFATHMQQIRIVDYLSRDVKRGLVVTTSVDKQTVTIVVPNYTIEKGDPEYIANPDTLGMVRQPTIVNTPSGPQVNYGPTGGATTRTVVYALNGATIQRSENGVVTTIASSTDELVPSTVDVELANTEYTKTSVSFRPMFTFGDSEAARTGTTVFSTAYLRNKRRG
jgi:prepilin-type N-terminal cleavage/methylation domain-containing protein